jgi:bacterioferritin (cytochrome b1)
MKGDPDVMAGLQEAITILASLEAQYALDGLDVKRLELDLGDGLSKLAEQCEDQKKCLLIRLLFLDGGAPVITPAPAATHSKIGDILTDATKAELAAVARFRALGKQAWGADDLSNSHYYQHLCKWHEVGDDKYKGHLAWLQQQSSLFGTLGDKDYIAVNAVKS